jgi:hypothetical protein
MTKTVAFNPDRVEKVLPGARQAHFEVLLQFMSHPCAELCDTRKYVERSDTAKSSNG